METGAGVRHGGVMKRPAHRPRLANELLGSPWRCPILAAGTQGAGLGRSGAMAAGPGRSAGRGWRSSAGSWGELRVLAQPPPFPGPAAAGTLSGARERTGNGDGAALQQVVLAGSCSCSFGCCFIVGDHV